MVANPPFDVAVLQFGEFLGSQSWPERICWLDLGDALIYRYKLVVVPPTIEVGREIARRSYERSARRRLGVQIEALAHTGVRTFAFIWGPRDEDEAARMMFLGGLKLSVPARNPPVRVVRSAALQWWFRAFGRRWSDVWGINR